MPRLPYAVAEMEGNHHVRTITLDYYYGLEAEQYTFFRIPKILFSPTYKTLSVSAKMLYALMLDRMSLSARNRWMDEDGRVFIYFRMSEIMSALAAVTTRQSPCMPNWRRLVLSNARSKAWADLLNLCQELYSQNRKSAPKRKYPQRLLVSMMTSPSGA